MQRYAVTLLALIWVASACIAGSGTDTENQGKKSEEVIEEEEEEEVQPEGANGTCADPYVLYPQGDSQTLPNRASAMVGSCGGEGAEVVYEFTLEEESGVNIQAGGADVVLYLLKDSCDAASEVSGACIDNPQDPNAVEELNIGSLAAGKYYLVVDTWSSEVQGTYSVTLSVTAGGFCVNDAYEPNNDANATISLGSSDIDTGAIDNGEGEPTSSVDFELCPDDVDFFAFGHMGGNISVAHTVVEEAGTMSGEILKLVMTEDEDGAEIATEGDSMGSLPFSGDLARDNYLLKFTATTDDATNGPNYTIAVDHDCEGDSLDNVDEALDDATLDNNSVALFETLDDPVMRTVCGADLDTFVLHNLAAGNVTATLTGGVALSTIVQSIDANNALTTLTSATTQVSGEDLVITLANAAAGDYLVTVSASMVSTTIEYGINAVFDGLTTGPSNDTCFEKETLTFVANVASASGHNLNATDDVDGPLLEGEDGEGNTQTYSCNGEDLADAALAEAGADSVGTPTDVFYYLTLSETTNLQLEFDGSNTGFLGALYMLEANGGTCPTDLSSLEFANDDDDTPLCAVGTFTRVRLADLAVNDYLVVVDGYFQQGYPSFGIPDSVSVGGFTLNATLYPDGFPAIDSCVNATATALPAAGASVELTVNYDDGDSWIDGYENCGDFAENARGGKEQIFILEPTSDVTLKVEASGDYDTVVEIREANTAEEGAFQCEKGTQVQCNDDGTDMPNFGSLIENAALTLGKTYYLVVDAFSGNGSGSVSVTLTAQ